MRQLPGRVLIDLPVASTAQSVSTLLTLGSTPPAPFSRLVCTLPCCADCRAEGPPSLSRTPRAWDTQAAGAVLRTHVLGLPARGAAARGGGGAGVALPGDTPALLGCDIWNRCTFQTRMAPHAPGAQLQRLDKAVSLQRNT